MWYLIVTLHLQYGLQIDKTVQPAVAQVSEAACIAKAATVNTNAALPIPRGYDAKWQSARCEKR